jgi:hypothetical protein
MATFEVVTAALAPLRHIQVFANYYRKVGADKVRVFYDGRLDGVPPAKCEVIECNRQFWETIGICRPASVEDRQRAIYNFAYTDAHSDWLLIVDIDEFVFGQNDLLDLYQALGPEYDSVRFGSVEAVFDSTDDIGKEYGSRHFRRPCNKYLAAVLPHILYPGLGGVFIRGLLGHSRGKHAVRTGLHGILIDIHDSSCRGKAMRELDASSGTRKPGFYLAHFDAISYQQWCVKWNRRIVAQDTKECGRKRDMQLQLFAEAASEEHRTSLFRRLYAVNSRQLFVLRALGLLIENARPDLENHEFRQQVSETERIDERSPASIVEGDADSII